MYRNAGHIPLPKLRQIFWQYVDGLGVWQAASNPHLRQLDTFFDNINDTSFKIIHPLVISGYKSPSMRHKTVPISVTGLDIETNAATGEPMLMGFWHPAPDNRYHVIYHPQLRDLFAVVRGLVNNSQSPHMIVWGNLDIQCLIRLFDPTEVERKRLSRGLSARVIRGKIVGSPPILREINHRKFYVSHYLPGRSLKLGYISGDRDYTIWIFNCSQFYPSTIAESAKGLGLEWIDFPKNTHLIDWRRYNTDMSYREQVRLSNQQDARMVSELAQSLQTRFNDAFDCYPSLLVSTGSLTDAVVSRMLSRADYASNSWAWLSRNVWQSRSRTDMARVETLLAETFSAGYVDQFAVGYFDTLCTADIAAAYPHKIRNLPDLRYSQLFLGSDDLAGAISYLQDKQWIIESAIIRGKVTIPRTLRFHPITVKTSARNNYRPTGTFHAGYTLEEREFCARYGATFKDEEFAIIALSKREPAPIALVSEELGKMRNDLLSTMTELTKESDRYKLLDGQQYVVKVVDNSIYGKTVQTVEVVEDLNGEPEITSFVAGDRFNLLFGSLITARTRVQIAEACNAISERGGRPVMTMTDSIYWQGRLDDLPSGLVRTEKTAGYFEPPTAVRHMYLLKTGQYEYEKDGKWQYKMRGLNVDRETLTGKTPFFRPLVKAACATTPFNHPKDIAVPVTTRRLMSVGRQNLELLGAIVSGTSTLKPFILSGKTATQYVMGWRSCLDGHIWLSPVHESENLDTHPLSFMRELFENGISLHEETTTQSSRIRSRRTSNRMNDLKMRYVLRMCLHTGRSPLGIRPWGQLREYYEDA
jgi:hypothetical protein